MVGGSAEAMVGLVYYFIGIDSCVEWSINSLVVVVDDKATRVITAAVVGCLAYIA